MCATHYDGSSADRQSPSDDGVTAGDVSTGRARGLRKLILGYQNYVSPLKLGPSCRFTPTCSAYSLNAFARFGVLKGFVLSAARLAKCGPWHPGGWDPVPPAGSRRHRH